MKSAFEVISRAEAEQPQVPADTQQAAREVKYVPKSPAVTFNRFAACSKETEIENRTNRIDIMQAEAD